MPKSSTPSLIAAIVTQKAIYASMKPSEKWQEVLRLRSIAMTLKKAFLVEKYPHWSPDEIEMELRKIFLYAST